MQYEHNIYCMVLPIRKKIYGFVALRLMNKQAVDHSAQL